MSRKTEQNFIGVLSIILGLISAVVSNGDITFGMIMVPLGFYLLVAKESIID